MKLIAPILIALLGLGAGMAAGVALKPAPETEHAAEPACPAEPCPAPDPLAPPAEPQAPPEAAAVPLGKPLVVPVFAEGQVRAMVVASVALALPPDRAPEVEALEPRLRDAFLQAMFRHANSGGFDGTFTEGRPMQDLRAALLAAAAELPGAPPVSDVLITEIARQDM